jgi:hypothetical protein
MHAVERLPRRAPKASSATRKPNPKGNPSGQGGQEQKYTEAEVREAFFKASGIVALVSSVLEVDRKTVYRYMERWPDLKEIRKDADEKTTDHAEANIMEAVIAKDKSMSQWWLKHKARHRGYGDSIEIAGPGGGPIQTESVVKVRFVKAKKEITEEITEVDLG